MGLKIDECPICGYPIKDCQCMYGGSSHPDRDKNRDVVFDHLYLLTTSQLRHVVNLQSRWQISYEDEERNTMINNLMMSGTTNQSYDYGDSE